MRLPRSLLHRANRVPICEVRKCGENLHLIDKEKFPEINGIHIGNCPCIGETFEFSIGKKTFKVFEETISFLPGELAHAHKISLNHVNCICFRRKEQLKYSPNIYSETFWHEYAHVKTVFSEQDVADNLGKINMFAHGPKWQKQMRKFGFQPNINATNPLDISNAYGENYFQILTDKFKISLEKEEPVENSR